MPLFAAIAAASLSAPLHAAPTSEDFQRLSEQVAALAQRVSRLEEHNSKLVSDNAALHATNEQLELQSESLRAETTALRATVGEQTAAADKNNASAWANRIVIKGDLRYRHEQIRDTMDGAAGRAADRYRDRIRARLGVEAMATDAITVGVQLATTERSGAEDNGDPRGANQTLGNAFSRKRLNLDLAYFDWQFAPGTKLTAGKMRVPFVRPGQSVFYDSDLNPEGVAVAWSAGKWFATGYGFWVNEVSGSTAGITSDTLVAGAQLGARLPLGSSNLLLAAHYYDLAAAEGRIPAPFYNAASNGNTTTGSGGTLALAHDFSVVELLAELNTRVGAVPLQVWVDAARNSDPDDLNEAWSLGAALGKAADARTWELAALYQQLEKDALFGQFVDSDFGGGVTDSSGWVLRAGYAPLKNWILNASYYLTQRDVDVGPESDHDRLQLDFNVKF